MRVERNTYDGREQDPVRSSPFKHLTYIHNSCAAVFYSLFQENATQSYTAKLLLEQGKWLFIQWFPGMNWWWEPKRCGLGRRRDLQRQSSRRAPDKSSVWEASNRTRGRLLRIFGSLTKRVVFYSVATRMELSSSISRKMVASTTHGAAIYIRTP